MAILARFEGDGVAITASGATVLEGLSHADVTADDLAAVDGLTLVSDLAADPRFAGSAWVRAEPRARALAFAPLCDSEGRRLGVVAAMDRIPRAWTADDAEALLDLSTFAVAGGVIKAPGAGGAKLCTDKPALGAEDSTTRTESAALRTENAKLRAENAKLRAENTALRAESPALRAENAALRAGSAALRESEERYRVIFERAGEAIFLMELEGDRAGMFLEANAKAAEMHGYTSEELMAMKSSDIIAPQHRGKHGAVMQRVLNGEWVEIESVHVRKDGARFPVEGVTGLVYASEVLLSVAFVRDITQRKRSEAALGDAKAAAEAASVAKSTFLANMSHELRTPMNAVLGYTQLLQRDASLTAAQQRYLSVVERSAAHLLELMNEVLEISRIEAGHRKRRRGHVNLGRLLDDIERAFRLRTDEKRLSFEIRRSEDVPEHIMGDEIRLRQVLTNLVGNAVKFTADGGVLVKVMARRLDPSSERLLFEVADTGPGIKAEVIDKLFRPFAQARVGISAQGGAGLGLALSRELARLLGGDITVESRVGTGSMFRLEVPLEVAAAPREEPAMREGRIVGIAGQGGPVRVLLVDDDEDSRGWVRLMLAEVGFDVEEAANGAEALVWFEQWRPGVVLLDMNMPVMDGYAAIRAIRALPEGQEAVIVAFTANSFDDEQSIVLQAGADAALRKPFHAEELLVAVGEQLGLTYLYRKQLGEPPSTARSDWTTRRRKLARVLPKELIAELREAARAADYDRLTTLIAELSSEHAEVAEALQHHVERYQYEQIEAILRG